MINGIEKDYKENVVSENIIIQVQS